MSIAIKLKGVRLSFPDLFTPVKFNEDDKKKRYNASFLVVPGSDNDKAIQAAILSATDETLGKKAAAFLAGVKGNSNKYCYVSGDTKEYDGYAGMMVLSSHRNSDAGKPGVFDCTRAGEDGKPLPLDEDSGKPYAGCYVNASLDIYVQEGKYPGVRCGLKGVFFARDGDAFSGSAASKNEDFDIEDGAGASDLA